MRLLSIFLASALSATVSIANAEDWAGVTVPDGQGRISNVDVTRPDTPINEIYGGEAVIVSCQVGRNFSNDIRPVCPDPNTRREIAVPISEFARSASVDALAIDVDDLRTSIALTGALDIALLPNGQQNRVGLVITDVADEQAFGVSYARVQGNVDFGVAFAASGSDNAAKAGAGFSW